MKKKLLVGAAVLLATGTLVLTMTGATSSKVQSVSVRTVTLQRGSLAKTVSATGTVYSQQSTDVYSSMNYPVKAVHVAVGDRVAEGDILAELDMADLESDIKQKQASVWASQQTVNQNISVAQKELETYQKNLENSHDSTVLNAEAAVTSAELEIQSAELEIQSASSDLSAARRDLREARDDSAEDSELRTLKDAVRAKENALDKAQSTLEKAQAELDKANKGLDVAKVGSGDTLQTYQEKVKTAQMGTNFNDQYIAIQKLQGDMEKAAVTASVSGTITAVNAVEGGSGNGLLFVIQETDSLKVVTNIKEYDIDRVAVGNSVTIKSDATEDKEFAGTLTLIAPTSTQTASGSAQTGTDAEYKSEVAVSGGKSGLRVGMNVRLSIITQEKKGVFAVPYEAVATNEAGQTVVFAAASQEDGSLIAQEIPVETGMDTDLYMEITSESLEDGMEIIKNAEGVTSGMAVTTDTGTENGGKTHG